MVTPLAVATTASEVSWDTTTLRKRTHPTWTSTGRTRGGHEDSTALNQQSIDVRWSLGCDLGTTGGHLTPIHPDGKPRQREDRPTRYTVYHGGQLLTSDHHLDVGPIGRGGEGGGKNLDERPSYSEYGWEMIRTEDKHG